MYKSIEIGLSSSHSFPASCRNLEEKLLHLCKTNKKDILACFNAASFALGHNVPLSFAPMLIPAIDRATCSRVKYSGGLKFNPTQIFAQKDYERLCAWRRVCVCVARRKRLRKRTDGRFGSEKVTKKPRKKIQSDTKIGLFKKISEISFTHDKMSTVLQRITNVFETNSDCVVTDFIVSLTCPFSLTRMKVPVRTNECNHITCFDLENFAKIAETQKDFEISCPECKSKKKWKTNQLLVDPLFEEILEKTTQDTRKVRLYKDGKWEAITEGKEEKEEGEDSGELLLESLLMDVDNESDNLNQRDVIDLS